MKRLKYQAMGILELQELHEKLKAEGANPTVIKAVERKLEQMRRKVESGIEYQKKRQRRASNRKAEAEIVPNVAKVQSTLAVFKW